MDITIKKYLSAVILCALSPMIGCSDDKGTRTELAPEEAFDPEKDLFLAFYDNKPDPDDIHSQAATATVLSDSRFQNIDFHAVLGTYGRQRAKYLDSQDVMRACFGNEWSNAHPKEGEQWLTATSRVRDRVLLALKRGGDIWIMEAGQSDFSADVIRSLDDSGEDYDLKSRINIVQHSNFNHRFTTDGDLEYVVNNANYIRIPDGNSSGNGTPRFVTYDRDHWHELQNLEGSLGACWTEARERADEAIRDGITEILTFQHFPNPAIALGGMDFSDTVEAVWILGITGIDDADDFFGAFISR